MRLISNQNTETHLTEILRAIECFDEIIICVAFLKCSGLNFLIEKLNKKKEKTIFYVGLDFYQTEPTALRQLLNYGHKVFLTQKSKVTFHPKIFYFKRKNNITAFIGSSNLTYGGLETNFETSIVFQTVTNSKIDNELKQAFNSFDKNSKVADSESIDYYEKLFDLYKQKHNQADDEFSIEEEKIIEEKRKIDEDPNQEKGKKKGDGNSTFSITKKYLSTWDDFFNQFIEFSKSINTVIIPRDYSNHAFNRWYRLQKIFYADDSIDSEYELKYFHIDKLEKAGFYFGDAHKLLQQNIEDEWLNILEDIISDPVEKNKIQVNHRYKPGGHRLGTWLVGVSQENKKQNPKSRKVELKRKIEELGFNFTKTSRKPEDTAQRFLNDLTNDKLPIKVDYQKKFNKQIIPRASKIPSDIREKIGVIWELKFNEKRSWERIKRTKDRTEEWKKFRYDIEINPERKWITGESKMGDLYNWVYHKRKSKEKMDLVIHYFTDTEKIELKNENFPID